MKRLMIAILIVMLSVVLFQSCSKKPAAVEPEQKAPVVEKVTEPQPQAEKPELTEEEMFLRNSLEEANRMGYLKKINFDYDKYDIKEEMKSVLQANATWLLGHGTVYISIEGHCDERGTVEYNMALGEKRADAAKRYLVSLGVPAEKIQTVSYGKSKPLVNGVDEESYYQNRRAEFIITKK